MSVFYDVGLHRSDTENSCSTRCSERGDKENRWYQEQTHLQCHCVLHELTHCVVSVDVKSVQLMTTTAERLLIEPSLLRLLLLMLPGRGCDVTAIYRRFL